MLSLRIKVYLNDAAKQNNASVFSRTVEVSESVCTPYTSLLSDFKFLFGRSCIVIFEIV